MKGYHQTSVIDLQSLHHLADDRAHSPVFRMAIGSSNQVYLY